MPTEVCSLPAYIWGGGNVLECNSPFKSPGISAVVSASLAIPRGLFLHKYCEIRPTPRVKGENLNIKRFLGNGAFPAWKVWVLQTQTWEASYQPRVFMSPEESLSKSLQTSEVAATGTVKYLICASKDTINRVKRKPTEWEKYLQTIYWIRG